MKTVLLDVRPPEDAMRDFVDVWKTGKAQKAVRRVGRDIKAVHSDLTALRKAGVVDRAESGRVEFPYETIKVEFMLRAA